MFRLRYACSTWRITKYEDYNYSYCFAILFYRIYVFEKPPLRSRSQSKIAYFVRRQSPFPPTVNGRKGATPLCSFWHDHGRGLRLRRLQRSFDGSSFVLPLFRRFYWLSILNPVKNPKYFWRRRIRSLKNAVQTLCVGTSQKRHLWVGWAVNYSRIRKDTLSDRKELR